MPNYRRPADIGLCYFITTNTIDRRPLFIDPRVCRILVDNLRFYRDRGDFLLHAYVIMPEHLHLVITTVNVNVSGVMRNLKSHTAKDIRECLGCDGPVWQERFHDRGIRGMPQFRAMVEYVHENPVKARLVDVAADWEFSSAGVIMEGRRGPLDVDALDGATVGSLGVGAGPRPTEWRRGTGAGIQALTKSPKQTLLPCKSVFNLCNLWPYNRRDD